VAVVESRDAYRDPDLSHRRAVVYFSSADVFVLVDEAIGLARGLVEIHFHLDHSRAVVDKAALAARSAPDANDLTNKTNIVVRSWAGTAHMNVSLGRSHQSSAMGRQRERAVVSFSQHKTSDAAVRFVTVVAPFDGPQTPNLVATIDQPPGATSVTVKLWRKPNANNASFVEEEMRYSFNPDELSMSPPPDEFFKSIEPRYTKHYETFRNQRRVLRECRETCAPVIHLHGGLVHIKDARKSLVHVPQHRFLYCGIPKCGVSRWRRLARRVSGVAEWADNGAHNPHTNGLR
jgi:hypothetical protein